jgi:hypothetical protein
MEKLASHEGDKPMNDLFDNLPSVGQMFKLVVVLLFAVIAFALVIAIVKMLIPLLILGAIIAGGVYVVKRMQKQNAAL